MAKEVANIDNTSSNLLGTSSRVETPSIGVKIGDRYVFGVYNTVDSLDSQRDYYHINPRFMKSLSIRKINGTVNQYTLKMEYPITQKDDPNLLDKVFSSVSGTRKISFSYGDLSVPSFAYKEEEAIITKVKKRTSVDRAVKSYTVSAVSTGLLNAIGTWNFRKYSYKKPSEVIREILGIQKYGLLTVFSGMKDLELVDSLGLIDGSDECTEIEAKNSISILDYLKYLVEKMRPAGSSNGLIEKDGKYYALIFHDDTTGPLYGPYFEVVNTAKLKHDHTAYEIDVGYPSQNVVTNWEVEDDETYSIYYDFASQLNTQETVQRLNDKGELETVFCPAFINDSAHFHAESDAKTWWTKVTEYPIKASITFKGLLRPAVLMTNVRVRILWYGVPDIDSGLYVVTAQEDNIDQNGFRTTLSLLRIGGDDTYSDYGGGSSNAD